jgi:glycerol uptake facilitator-like aquaporin
VTGATATAGIFSTYPVGEHLTWGTAFFDQVTFQLISAILIQFDIDFFQNSFVQILATAVLVFGVLAIVDEKNWHIQKGSVPIYIGLLICSIVLSLGYNTGVAMNPARDFMPRLFTYLAGWGPETIRLVD